MINADRCFSVFIFNPVFRRHTKKYKRYSLKNWFAVVYYQGSTKFSCIPEKLGLFPFTNTKTFDHITQVLRELGWLTIAELLRLRDVTMILKFFKGLAPSYLSTMLVKRWEIHSYCTRQGNQLNFPQCRTSAAQRAFRFRASKYWHSLY